MSFEDQLPDVTGAGRNLEATPVVILRPTAPGDPAEVWDPGRSAGMTPMGYDHLSTADLAAPVGLTVPDGATAVLLQNTGTQAIRWRDDGDDPVAGMAPMGLRLLPDMDAWLYAGDLAAIRFLREQEGAMLDVSFYR